MQQKCFLQGVLTVMLHKMCENYGNNPKCKIQVNVSFLKLIHKPPTLYVQVEARSTTRIIQFPYKPTCILVLHSLISNSHTHTHTHVEEENFLTTPNVNASAIVNVK